MSIRNMCISAVLAFGLVGATQADTLVTTMARVGFEGVLWCHAINVGKNPVDITVSLVRLEGTVDAEDTETCLATPPGAACLVKGGLSSAIVTRYCRVQFDGKKKVRGAMFVTGDSGNAQLSLEAQPIRGQDRDD